MDSKTFPTPEDIFGKKAKQQLVNEVIDFIRTKLEKATYVQNKIQIEVSELPHTSDQIVDQALVQIKHFGWETWKGTSTRSNFRPGEEGTYKVPVIEIRWIE